MLKTKPFHFKNSAKTMRGKKLDSEKITLREYESNDAKTIVTWLKDEYAFRQWCADRYGNFPITADDMNVLYEKGGVMPFTFFCGNEIAGHFIIRYPSENRDEVRLGFVIVDDKKRGQGFGKKMIQLVLKYAAENLRAKKVSLGVFENNPGALKCYKSCGFKEVSESAYTCFGERWKSIEMEISLE